MFQVKDVSYTKILKRLSLIVAALIYGYCAIKGIAGLFGFIGYFVSNILMSFLGYDNPLVTVIELIMVLPVILLLIFYSGKKIILLFMNKFDVEKLDIQRKVFYIFCDFIAITGLIRYSLLYALAFDDIYLLPRYTPFITYSILLVVFFVVLFYSIFISRRYFETKRVKNILSFTFVPFAIIVGYFYSIILRYMVWLHQFGVI